MMASILPTTFAAVVAVLFATALGLPLARRLFDDRSLAAALAPTLGWAVFSAAALPLLWLVGFSAITVGALATAALATGGAMSARGSGDRPPPEPASAVVPRLAYALAAICAVAPVMALMPKDAPSLFMAREAADAVYLAAPVFDHSKVAIVDEITRNGLPPQNPFYGSADAATPLVYYYLWHFGAAMLALLPSVSGWDADAALTGFTAFATLSLVMGLAVRASGRGSAAFWALALSLAASGRFVLGAVAPDLTGSWLSRYPGLGTVLVQATWAPQHVAAATCVVVGVLLIDRLAVRPGPLATVTLGLVAAAGFGSSVWIGAFVFGLVACAVAVARLVGPVRVRPTGFLAAAVASACIALIVASPILRDQISAAAARAGGLPLAFHPYEVLGPSVAETVRRALDLPAYWAVLLPIDFPAVYPVGVAVLVATLLSAGATTDARRFATTLAIVALGSFGVTWLLTSTLLNNDLGWRAVLPGVLALTAFAASGLARWTAPPFRWPPAVAAIALLCVGLPDGLRFIGDNAGGLRSDAAQAFGRSPALWAAVRSRSGPNERIANNPAAFAQVTLFPINISWALLADRRSCYAAWEFARPFAPLSAAAVDGLDREFRDVFDGRVRSDAAHRLFAQHDCSVVVVTPADGAWNAGTFEDDPAFVRLEERPETWRIYRLTR